MLVMKTKTNAIYVAKQMIKEQSNCKRLTYSFVNNSNANCQCGETCGVKVTALIGGKTFIEDVGICENCGGKP